MTPDEFVRRWENSELPETTASGQPEWRRSRLVRYDPSIDTLAIPEISRRFLIEGGLPSHVYHSQFGRPDTTLPPLPPTMPEWDFPPGYDRYRVLAIEIATVDENEFYMGFMCLDLMESGCVVHISTLLSNRVAFVNTSVEQFAEYLLLMRGCDEWLWKYHLEHHIDFMALPFEERYLASKQWNEQRKTDQQAYADKTIARLRQIDPDGIDGYWNEDVFYIRDLDG